MEFIIGPCVIESHEHAFRLADRLKAIETELRGTGNEVRFIFKASYSKPNRSDGSSFSGVGIEDGLVTLMLIRHGLNMPVTSDVHTPQEAIQAGEVLDVIQIPHQACKNTPIITAAALSKKARISVKKGTFYDAKLFHHTVTKIRSAGNYQNVIAIERGNCFGYGDTVVDMRNLALLRLDSKGERDPSVIPCIDATHPGNDPEHAKLLAKSGVAAGAECVFLEVHDDPYAALCDGHCAIPIDEVASLVRTLVRIQRALH